MQQAYQALRVVSEAQTVRIVLSAHPGELALQELTSACAGLRKKSATGIKAVILDFVEQSTYTPIIDIVPERYNALKESIYELPQPVLGVARANLSLLASRLLGEADFTLGADEILLALPASPSAEQKEQVENRVRGLSALRLGYLTWSVPQVELSRELERILNMLRDKSALALRNAKAAVRMAQQTPDASQALKLVNQFYLQQVLPGTDAQEGLQTILQQRQKQ